MKLNNLEYAFLITFSIVFLATGLSVFGGTASHAYPTGYFASDSFFHQSETTWLKEQGNIKYALPSMEGGRKDVYDSHPPFLFEATGVFSYATGLEVYDAIYIMVILMLLLLALLTYAIASRVSKNAAVMGLPLTLLVFTPPFSQVIHFGQWLFIAGALFMVASFWAISRLEEKHSYILLAAFMAATAISHQPELLFSTVFIAIFIVARWVRTKHDIRDLIPLAIAGTGAFILSAYSLNIFRLTWMMTYLTDAKLGLTSGTGVSEKGFSDVSWLSSIMGIGQQTNIWLLPVGIAIIAGIIISVLMMINKKEAMPAWIGIYIIAISYLTFLGLAKRSFAHRWLWHFYFAFFFGMALYYGLKILIRNWNIAYSAAIAIILTFSLAAPSYAKMKGSIMDPYNWEAMKWASENTPENKSIFVFNLGGLQQSAALYNMRRASYIIHRNSYIKAFSNQKEKVNSIEDINISGTYEFGLATAYSHLLCSRGGLFNYGYYHTYLPTDKECHQDFAEPTSPERNINLCNMEYYYITVQGTDQAVDLYNYAMAQKLMKKTWIRQEYSNPTTLILKNEKPGENCLD